VQLVILGAMVLGRQSRKSTLAAVEALERATRQVVLREALLAEANQALERAIGEGNGRWSGERVGPWKLGRLLGRGGMGEVYDATGEGGARAAVKLLLADSGDDPDAAKRFEREAIAMGRVASPNVVQVYDVADGSSGPPYIAMERLDGASLAAILRKRRRLPVAEVADIVVQVARALDAARERDIVHRDMKPQNVFWVEATRLWKVLDFGISKLGTSSGTLTQGALVGTPSYMAPEQVLGRQVDHRADVFSLAVVAYRAATGSPAFSGPDPAATMFNVVHRQPARPTTLAPIPLDIECVLALGLAKNPRMRMARATELADAFASAAEGRLSSELRGRAASLLTREPWGGEVSPKWEEVTER